MKTTQKVALSTLFILFAATVVFGAQKVNIVPKPEENSLQILGESEFCEKSYDKCADACEKKSKTEKQLNDCMEACEANYDACYENEAQKALAEEAKKQTSK